MLEYSRSAVVELRGSSDHILAWLLLCFYARVCVTGFDKTIIIGADIWSCLCLVGFCSLVSVSLSGS